jgi:hypothetical protein
MHPIHWTFVIIVGALLLWGAVDLAWVWWRRRTERRDRQFQADIAHWGHAYDHCLRQSVRSLAEYLQSPEGQELRRRMVLSDAQAQAKAEAKSAKKS